MAESKKLTNSKENLQKYLLKIGNALKGERDEDVIFLCKHSKLINDQKIDTVQKVFEALKKKKYIHQDDHRLSNEILTILGRNDLLLFDDKEMHAGKTETDRPGINPFIRLLYDLQREMNPTERFNLTKEMIKPDKTQSLEEHLTVIERQDLCEMIRDFRTNQDNMENRNSLNQSHDNMSPSSMDMPCLALASRLNDEQQNENNQESNSKVMPRNNEQDNENLEETAGFQKTLVDIGNALRGEWNEDVIFLCKHSSFINDQKIDTVHKVFQALKEKKYISADDPGLLNEILTTIGRNDLCLEMERRTLTETNRPSCINLLIKLLYEIQSELNPDEVYNLKNLFLVERTTETGCQLFSHLIKVQRIRPDATEELENKLKDLGKNILAAKLRDIVRRQGDSLMDSWMSDVEDADDPDNTCLKVVSTSHDNSPDADSTRNKQPVTSTQQSASCEGSFQKHLVTIGNSLRNDRDEDIIFLCRHSNLITDHRIDTVHKLLHALKEKNYILEEDPGLLNEILTTIGRNDLLLEGKKILGTNRPRLNPFFKLLYEIQNDLTSEELFHLRNLFSVDQNIESGCQLFSYLIDNQQVSPDDSKELVTNLKVVGRDEQAAKLLDPNSWKGEIVTDNGATVNDDLDYTSPKLLARPPSCNSVLKDIQICNVHNGKEVTKDDSLPMYPHYIQSVKNKTTPDVGEQRDSLLQETEIDLIQDDGASTDTRLESLVVQEPFELDVWNPSLDEKEYDSLSLPDDFSYGPPISVTSLPLTSKPLDSVRDEILDDSIFRKATKDVDNKNEDLITTKKGNKEECEMKPQNEAMSTLGEEEVDSDSPFLSTKHTSHVEISKEVEQEEANVQDMTVEEENEKAHMKASVEDTSTMPDFLSESLCDTTKPPKEVEDQNANLKQTVDEGYTSANMTAQSEDTSTIPDALPESLCDTTKTPKEIEDKNTNLNKTVDEGNTSANMAARTEDTSTMPDVLSESLCDTTKTPKEIEDKNTNLNKTVDEGNTSANMAARTEDTSTMPDVLSESLCDTTKTPKEIEDKNTNLNKTVDEGNTSANMAARTEDTSTMPDVLSESLCDTTKTPKEIEDKNTNLNKTVDEGNTSANMAARTEDLPDPFGWIVAIGILTFLYFCYMKH